MKFSVHIVLGLVWFGMVYCKLEKFTKADICGQKCDHCFQESDSLGRMRCEEICELEDPAPFSCSIGESVIPASHQSLKQPLLRYELDEINKERTEYVKTRNFEGLAGMFHENASYIADTIPVGFGKEAVLKAFAAWFNGNPHIAYATFTSTGKLDDFGEDMNSGKVWDNGEMRAYDSDDNYLTSSRYVIIYKRIDGKLLEYQDVLFKTNDSC